MTATAVPIVIVAAHPPPAPGGLSNADAARILSQHGANELVREDAASAVRIFVSQFKGAMVLLLMGAIIVSTIVGDTTDAIAIAVILVLNAVVGFFQEFRAERAVQALKKMTAPRARVVRDARAVEVPAADVVPGDVLVLDAGDIVAADAHLIEASRLQTNEAALTGESVPVEKRVGVDPQPVVLAERFGDVFAGTSIAAGSARAVVTATGMATELGKIAKLLSSTADETTPLQKRLEGVGRMLLVLCLAVVALVFAIGLFRGVPFTELLLTSVSLAVAAVPEGLAAIVTVALAIGVRRMVSQNVLIRRLPAVETLGCATVVCTDKTGTLTTGKMVVREVWGVDRARVVDVAAACSDAELAADELDGTGDAMEVALLVDAARSGVRRAEIEKIRPRQETFPFDADRKRMSVLRSDGVLYVKGAIDLMLPLCASGTAGAAEANAEMARRGLRVLAAAVGKSRNERDLELVGLIGLADPPRPEAMAAVEAARQAGVRTVMITGDHPDTAHAIALEMGILRQGDDDAEIVHARATPQDKIDVVRRLKARGDVVAMTGDGVNDAPALKDAHIGIAMGKSGTEVTREAADMVLVDDNFASIIAAIREGRGVYDNIQKALVYLLGGNVGELLIMLVAMIVGLPLPLTALQILWVNLVTDGLPALALVTDPSSKDILARPPRRANAPILGRREWTSVAMAGALTAASSLGVFVWALEVRNEETARNLAFSTLVMGQLLRAFAARSPDKTLFEVGALQNRWLVVVVGGSAALQIAMHHLPLTQRLFGIHDLSLADCVLTVAVGLVPVTLIEVGKIARRVLRSRKTSRSLALPGAVGLLMLIATSRGAQAQHDDALPDPLGVQDVIAIARDQRGEVVAARERATAGEQRPAVVGALDDPMVSPSVDHWPFGMMAADVSLAVEQRFPLSGVLFDRRRVAEADAKRLSLEKDRAVLDVELDAVLSFFMLYERRGLLRILEEQHALAMQLVPATNARYQSGTAPQADVIRAEIEVARVEASLKSTAAQIKAAESMLNASLGRRSGLPVPGLIYAAVTTTPPESSAVVCGALERRPELRAGQAEIGRARAEVDVMRSMYMPMGMVRAGPAYTMADGPGAMLMVGISIPLWRDKLGAGVLEAEAMARMATADLEAMRRMTEGQAAAARDEVAAARAQFLSLRDDVVPRVRQAIAPSLSGYAAGQLPLVSVVEAVAMLWTTQAQLLAAEVSLGAAWARLGRETGDVEGMMRGQH